MNSSQASVVAPPVFLVDLRDRATGKQVALRLTRAEALRPWGQIVTRLLRCAPEQLVAERRLAAPDADLFFRMQDAIFPLTDAGELGQTPVDGLVWLDASAGGVQDPAQAPRFVRQRRADAPDLLVFAVELDRQETGYSRNWTGFHRRRFERYRPLVDALLVEAQADGDRLDDPVRAARFVEAVARRIWQGEFENYSRFLAPHIRLKTGDETVESILRGTGGVCTEKVLALKLVTDGFELPSQVVFAGPRTDAPPPYDELRVMLDELEDYDFTYARRYLRYWDHVALEVALPDGSSLLVDPSNGNIPFLCDPASAFLNPGPERRRVPVRVLAVEEPVTYHRAPEQLTLDFLYTWETWIEDVDLLQVFDNQLGLVVNEDVFVTVAMSASRTKRAVALDSWREYAVKQGLAIGIGSDAAREAETVVWQEYQRLHPVQAAACIDAVPYLERRYREHIRARYGVDKPFRADLIALDRRSLLARLGAA